jgi:hypothetical protein
LSVQVRDKLVGKARGGLIGSKSSVSDRGIFHKNDNDPDGGDDGGSKLKKMFGIFKKDDVEGEKEGNFIHKLFDKLPNKIDETITPLIIEFEHRVIEHVENELRDNIFKSDKFKGGVKSKVGDDDDDDDDDDKKNTFTDKIGSLFKKS